MQVSCKIMKNLARIILSETCKKLKSSCMKTCKKTRKNLASSYYNMQVSCKIHARFMQGIMQAHNQILQEYVMYMQKKKIPCMISCNKIARNIRDKN